MEFNFNINGLYKRTPKQGEQTWCRNFTYIPRLYGDSWYMSDTYYNNYSILVNEDNVNEFEFIFDFNEIVEINQNIADEYEDKEVFRVPIDSGGSKGGGCCFIKKGTRKSISKQIEKRQKEIEGLKIQLEWIKQDLERLKDIEDKNE